MVAKQYKEWKYWHCEGQCRNFILHKMRNWVLLWMRSSCNLLSFCSHWCSKGWIFVENKLQEYCYITAGSLIPSRCCGSYMGEQCIKKRLGIRFTWFGYFRQSHKSFFPIEMTSDKIKKCLLGKLNLVFPSKSQIYLQFEITDKDSAEWDFRSFIATRRRMHDELCKLGNWRSGMNLIISKYCSNLIWHKTWFNLDMEHFSKDIFNFWKPLPHVCASQMHFAIDLLWLCWIQCVAIREAID